MSSNKEFEKIAKMVITAWQDKLRKACLENEITIDEAYEILKGNNFIGITPEVFMAICYIDAYKSCLTWFK